MPKAATPSRPTLHDSSIGLIEEIRQEGDRSYWSPADTIDAALKFYQEQHPDFKKKRRR